MPSQDLRKILAGVGPLDGGNLLWSALGDNGSAAISSLGPHVDDPIGGFDDIQIVLNDEDRVALIDKTLQHQQQLADVLEVQAGGGLVKDIQGPTRGTFLQLGGQLDALGLPTSCLLYTSDAADE